MLKSDIDKMQQYFLDYINASNKEEKNIILDKCKNELTNESKLIDRLINIINNLNNNSETLKVFINNIFDTANDIIRLDLIENLESQINNKTVYNMRKVENKLFTIISFFGLKKEITTANYNVLDSKIIYNEKTKELIRYKESDTFFNNYLVEKISGIERKDLLLAYYENKKYVISDNELPKICNSKILKEESLCETKDIQYFLEHIIGEKENRNDYLIKIFLDLVTNQNYRIINNGLDVINSDLEQDEYYVLNGVTLKKKVAILSFIRNYYSEIEEIGNLILDNYEFILEFLEKIECNENYKNFLINSIKYINEQIKIRNSLNAIETGEDYRIYSESRIEKNEMFKNKLDTLYNSVKSNVQTLSKKGYASIYTLVFGIISCGIFVAYLMMIK